jgi:hypothetical protein
VIIIESRDGHDIERSMVTQETQGFLDSSGLPEDNSPTSYVLVLLMAPNVVVVLLLGVPLPLLLYPMGVRLQGR